MSQEGHMAKDYKSRLGTAIAQVKEPETGKVPCSKCGEDGHLKENCQRTVDTRSATP